MTGGMTNGASGPGVKTAGQHSKLVLVACDDSQAAIKCVEWALATFNQKDTTFGLVHVVPSGSGAPGFAYAGTAELTDQAAMDGEEGEVSVIGCEDDNLSAIGDAISHFAESSGADLIVASRHDKGIISHLFLGSTSARLAKSSAVPLTILP
eukprot:jgi/Astpho2/1765/fgenesh1_pg.00032_%23_87_t